MRGALASIAEPNAPGSGKDGQGLAGELVRAPLPYVGVARGEVHAEERHTAASATMTRITMIRPTIAVSTALMMKPMSRTATMMPMPRTLA